MLVYKVHMMEAKMEFEWGPKNEGSWVLWRSLSFILYTVESHKTYAHENRWLVLWLKNKQTKSWTSLVVQWLRICLPIWETWVQLLVQEDCRCRRETKPICHKHWSPCSTTRESIAMRSLHTTSRESLCAATKAQYSQKQICSKLQKQKVGYV